MCVFYIFGYERMKKVWGAIYREIDVNVIFWFSIADVVISPLIYLFICGFNESLGN